MLSEAASKVIAQASIMALYHLVGMQAYGDVVIGSVLGPSSQRANECRIAMFLAGYPETVPVRTVNRYAIRPVPTVPDSLVDQQII